MQRILPQAKAFYRRQEATVAVEFAFLLPLLLFLIFGTLELVHYTQYNQKMDSAASQLVNVLNQNFNPSLADINVIMDATEEIIRPFNGTNLTIAITAVQQNDPDPTILPDVMWQVGRNMVQNPSRIAPGGQGSKVTIPGLTLRERDQVIFIEMFNQYIPLMNNFITADLIQRMLVINYKFHMGRPRYGAFQFAPS